MIQIRNVPAPLHRELTERAAAAGMSLSDYLKAELSRLVARPTVAQFLARLETRSPVHLPIDPATLVRQERDSR